MMEFAIIRHGETDWNAVGRMQGQRDIPLNANGLRQAEQIAERLREQRWDAIYSSDLLRAAATAERIAERLGIDRIVRDVRLRERSFGRIEGTTLADRIQRYGEGWMERELGVESDERLSARALEALEEAMRSHPQGRIIIVSHGGWTMQLMERLFPGQYSDKPGNTALSCLRFTEQGWQCPLYNCTAHIRA